jgi:hypothetical protein
MQSCGRLLTYLKNKKKVGMFPITSIVGLRGGVYCLRMGYSF